MKLQTRMSFKPWICLSVSFRAGPPYQVSPDMHICTSTSMPLPQCGYQAVFDGDAGVAEWPGWWPTCIPR